MDMAKCTSNKNSFMKANLKMECLTVGESLKITLDNGDKASMMGMESTKNSLKLTSKS